MTKTTLLKCLPWLVMLCGLGGNAWADGVNEAIPSYYQEAGISKTRSYINQNDAEHIDPFTGKLQFHFVDLFIPGNGGLDLKVQRSYNSINEYDLNSYESSPVGLGWTLHFGRVLKWAGAYLCDAVNIPKRNAVFELPDGSRRVFYPSLANDVSWVTTDFWRAECGNDSQVALKIYSPDGTLYEMGVSGMTVGSGTNVQNTTYVSKIIDRNGNWLSFTYQNFLSGVTGVKTVSSSDGRSVIFNYAGSNLTSITDQTGVQTWASYSYTDSGVLGHSHLREVMRPHGQKWKFEYNSVSPGQRALRQITYPTGGKVDYAYSLVQFAMNASIPQSTVVTQKIATRANTVAGQITAPIVDTWTFTYKPATEALAITPSTTQPGTTDIIGGPCSALLTEINLPGRDSTVIDGPAGFQFYVHYGYNSISPGFVHLIGSQICSGNNNQLIVPKRQAIQISNQTNIRPGDTLAFDTVTYAVLNAGQYIARTDESFDTKYSDFDDFGNPQTIIETGSGSRAIYGGRRNTTNSKTTNITYNNIPSKWIIRQKKNEIVSEGAETLTTTRTFDANGNMLTEVHAGVPSTYTYHPTGDLASKTDARLKTTLFSNYHRGIARTEQQPGGALPPQTPEIITITRLISDSGNIISETDGEGATTSFSYDNLNRVTGITHPLGNPVVVLWGENSRTATRGKYVAATTFDGFGREIESKHIDTNINGQTIKQTYMLDSLGRRVFASYPNSPYGTKYTYDMLNRSRIIFNEYDPATDSYADYQYKTYEGLAVTHVDERLVVKLNLYRVYGNPDKVELVETSVGTLWRDNQFKVDSLLTKITRNIAGQMTAVNWNGVIRSYNYDVNYFLSSSFEPETGTTLMGRDAVGNLTSRQVDNSAVTNYSYDDRNRLVGITYPVGTPSVIKSYFKDDKLKSLNNGSTKRDYVYDANKNLTSEILTVGAKVFPLVYGYNANDAHTFIQYGSNKTVNYAPDAFGRPTQATPYVNTVAYHPSGQASNYTFANGVSTAIELNARQWPTSLKIKNNNNLLDISYRYDGVGNVTQINGDSEFQRKLSYDNLNQLATFNTNLYSSNDQIINYTKGDIISRNSYSLQAVYSYDGVKNRLSAVTGEMSTVYGSLNYVLQYDVYGNVISNGKNNFAYNDASQMKCANCNFPNEITYVYDGNGLRVKSRKNNLDTFYVYGLSGQLLWEETPNNSLKEYIYLGGKQVATREQILQ
jgi:YD repeat-containing protein